MSIARQAVQYGARRLTRKLIRAAPFLGAVVAIATVGGAMRRKGFLRGALDTALDFIPLVGGAKNAIEIARGRDLLADRIRGPR
jgi:putative toxin of predicted polymorphic toxin system